VAIVLSEGVLNNFILSFELFLCFPDGPEVLQLFLLLLLLDETRLEVLGCDHVRVILLLLDLNRALHIRLLLIHIALLLQ